MSNAERGRFVPSGVDPQSWIGFEQRVEERRFRALVDSINRAINTGNAVEARVALEEARELRPAAPDLDALEVRIDALTLVVANSAPPIVWPRIAGAVMLLLFGIGLLVGLDWMRSTDTSIESVPAISPPVLRVAEPATIPAEPFVMAVSAPRMASSGQSVTPSNSRETPDDYVFRAPRGGAPPRPLPLASTPRAAVPVAAAVVTPVFDDATLKPTLIAQ